MTDPAMVEEGLRAAHMQRSQNNRDKVAAIIDTVQPLILEGKVDAEDYHEVAANLGRALIRMRDVEEQIQARWERAVEKRNALSPSMTTARALWSEEARTWEDALAILRGESNGKDH